MNVSSRRSHVPLNLDRLRTFSLAAELLNFSRAGRLLHLSQPAISQQIRELEDALAVKLFERRSRCLALTPAGEHLKIRSKAILREVGDVVASMQEFSGMAQGFLPIGATNTLGDYLLPFALGHFSRSHPGIKTSLRVADIEEIVRCMNEGEIDLAVVDQILSPETVLGWQRLPLMEEEIVIAVPPDHPWAATGEVSHEALCGSPFILQTEGHPLRQLIRNCLAEAGFDPELLAVRFKLDPMEGIKRAVLSGLGVGFVSRAALGFELERGLLREVRIQNCPIKRTLWVLQPKRQPFPYHLRLFSEMLRSRSWLSPDLACLLKPHGQPVPLDTRESC